MAIYRVSSHDPLCGFGSQGHDHVLVTSVEDGERWVRNLYACVGASDEVGPLRCVEDGRLWAMDGSVGRVWFIAKARVHQSSCPLLDRPTSHPRAPLGDIPRCTCEGSEGV
jgi:hypothetical protein